MARHSAQPAAHSHGTAAHEVQGLGGACARRPAGRRNWRATGAARAAPERTQRHSHAPFRVSLSGAPELPAPEAAAGRGTVGSPLAASQAPWPARSHRLGRRRWRRARGGPQRRRGMCNTASATGRLVPAAP